MKSFKEFLNKDSLNEAVSKAHTNNKGTLEIEKILNPYGIGVNSAKSYGKDIFISIDDPEGDECGANLVYGIKEGHFGVSVGGTTYSLADKRHDLNKLSKALVLRVELCKKLDALMKKLKPEDFLL